MTPIGSALRDEIVRSGPIPFHRFMEMALYEPAHGYYRRGRDPFGKSGDYYTAEQVQPAFGILMRSLVRSLTAKLRRAETSSVVELGAGRGEMAEFFREFRYVAVEVGEPMPARFRGVVFGNEFFDALPVHVAVRRRDGFRDMLVGWNGQRFCWHEGPAVCGDVAAYLAEYGGAAADGAVVEVNLDALSWIDRIASNLDAGFLLAIDYGYTSAELMRFPSGTLMAYRHHIADEDVLAEPGERDITAHVCFTALERRAAGRGFRRERFESLASTLLRTGEADQFAEVLAARSERAVIARRLQLKKLLFGMGESFRVLLMVK